MVRFLVDLRGLGYSRLPRADALQPVPSGDFYRLLD